MTIERLENATGKTKGLLYVELISHMKRVADYMLKQEPEMRERMEEITMGGQVYETLADQLLAQGREEGREEGHAEGHAEGVFYSVDCLVKSGKCSEEEACALLGAKHAEYIKFKEKAILK